MNKGRLPADRELFWRVGAKAAVRRGPWKLVRAARAPMAWELYDLVNDIGETTDLAARQPERVRELSAAWERWNLAQRPPLWR